MNLAAVLVTGLFAGGVSCAAVQGGLLTGLISRQRKDSPVTTSPVPAGRHRKPAAQTVERRTVLDRVGDDLAPVGGFLAGKLVSHTVLGALLGALGSAAQLSVSTRTTLQLAAGAVIIVFGLAQLGVPGFRNIVIEPPRSWMKAVRGRARSQSALAPGLLGLATVLIPCGVTLSVEALALTSGSALTGAATMAVFVIGTAPLFTLLGFAARWAATAWRGRLAALTGIAVVVMGFYTINGGLELSDSRWAASRIAERIGISEPPPVDVSTVSVQNGRQEVVITASSDYSPGNVQVRAGLPTTLVVRSQDAKGCLRSFVIPHRDIDKILPENGDTRIDLGVLTPGRIRYVCGMGMYTGLITVV